MAEAEFEALLDKSLAELTVKQNGHMARWSMEKYARWDMQQGTGVLTFTDPVRGKAVMPAQIVGSWFADDSTWMWAWANTTIDDKLKRDAEQVRRFGQEHKLTLLTQAKSTVPEAEAWRLAALAVHLCKAEGVYRGPDGRNAVFMTFGEVRRTPARQANDDDD